MEPVLQEWTSAHGRGVVLGIPAATLEILDPAHAEMVDQIEVGKRVAGRVRFAFQIANLPAAVKSATAGGARLLHEPVETPWKDLNARLVAPDGLPVTLFQAPSRRST